MILLYIEASYKSRKLGGNSTLPREIAHEKKLPPFIYFLFISPISICLCPKSGIHGYIGGSLQFKMLLEKLEVDNI